MQRSGLCNQENKHTNLSWRWKNLCCKNGRRDVSLLPWRGLVDLARHVHLCGWHLGQVVFCGASCNMCLTTVGHDLVSIVRLSGLVLNSNCCSIFGLPINQGKRFAFSREKKNVVLLFLRYLNFFLASVTFFLPSRMRDLVREDNPTTYLTGAAIAPLSILEGKPLPIISFGWGCRGSPEFFIIAAGLREMVRWRTTMAVRVVPGEGSARYRRDRPTRYRSNIFTNLRGKPQPISYHKDWRVKKENKTWSTLCNF